MIMRCLIGLVAVLLPVTAAFGQPGPEYVAKDSWLYVQWVGTDHCQGYQGSNCQKLVDGFEARGVNSAVIDSLCQWLGEQGDDAELAAFVRLTGQLWPVISRRGFVYSAEGRQAQQGRLVIHAGDQAEQVSRWLNQFARQMPAEAKLRVVRRGQVVQLLAGDVRQEWVKPEASFNANANAIRAIRQHQIEHASLLGWCDVTVVLDLLDQHNTGDNRSDQRRRRQAMVRATGLNGIDYAVYSGGFENRLWKEQLYLHAPSPRKGFLGAMTRHALDDTLSGRIPDDVDSVSLWTCEMPMVVAAWQQVGSEPGMIDPSYHRTIDQEREQSSPVDADEESLRPLFLLLNQALADNDVDAKSLARAMGSQWALISDRRLAGNGLVRSVLVHQSAQPKVVAAVCKSAIQWLGRSFVKELIAEISDSDVAGIQLQSKIVEKIGRGGTVCWPQSPALLGFGQQQETFFMAMAPQFVEAAMMLKPKADPVRILTESIGTADRPNVKVVAVQRVCLDRIAKDNYLWMLMCCRLMFADIQSRQDQPMPMMCLPSWPELGVLLKAPALQTVSVDDQGVTISLRQPLPGAVWLFNPSQFYMQWYGPMLGQIFLGGALGLSEAVKIEDTPATQPMAKAPPMPIEVKLQHLHLHMMALAVADGKAPPTLGDLAVEGGIDPTLTNSRGAKPEADLDDKALAQWINAQTDITYDPSKVSFPVDPDAVIFKARAEGHSHWVCLGDGRVKKLQP